MSTLLEPLRPGSKRAARRIRSADRRRQPVLERLEDLVLLANTPILVTNTDGSGPGSLDAAIQAANAAMSSAPTAIDFNIPGTGPETILVGSGTGSCLQTIRVPIILDGWSEGDFQNGTPAGTYQGSPLIVLDGRDVTTNVGPGLDFAGESSSGPGSSGSVVEGLDLVNWQFVTAQDSGGTAIEIEGGASLAGTSPAANVTIEGNYIGVGPDGKFREPNYVYGVLDQGNNNTIGGTTAAARNVIADNGANLANGENGAGVAVYPAMVTVDGNTVTGSVPTGNIIEGNYIGLAANGRTPVANALGVLVGFPGTTTMETTIGGTTSAAGNTISGNTDGGIELTAASETTIQSNQIGTDSTGVFPVGNGGVGIFNANSDHTTIGGPGAVPAPGNLIAANLQSGIFLTGSGSTDALIQGNTIGAAGMTNGQAGIAFLGGANANTVGGTSTGDGNIIQSNDLNGVVVGLNPRDTATVGNTIEGNSIFANRGLGIDLSNDGLTPNQTVSTVTPGPNDLQNYPVLTAVTTSGGTTTIAGTFDDGAEPDTTLRIEFFGDLGTGETNGQGQTFLGFTQVSTDANGHAAFTNVPISDPPTGDIVSSTATVVSTFAGAVTVGDTSEFSADVTPAPPTLAATMTKLESSENPSTYGGPVTFTAIVASQALDTPTGDVTFSIDGAAQPPVPLMDAGGVQTATFDDSSLGGGPHTIAATYGGDSNFTTSTATLVTQVVNPAVPAILLASSENPAKFGDSITFTATVASPAGGTPTGSVVFTIDGTAQSAVALSGVPGEDVATLEAGLLLGGPHTIAATYGGDSNFSMSTATPVTQVVSPAPTTTTLGSARNASTFGQSVTFTATVSPDEGGTLTGNVTFSIDGTTQPAVPLVSVGGVETATLNDSSLGGGPHTIAAAYDGDNNDAASMAPPLTQTVNPAPTTTTLSSSSNPSASFQTVIFTATVTAVGDPPTGSVTFSIDGTPQTPVPLTASGNQLSATFTVASLFFGSPSIGATYGGDGNFATSTAPPLTQVVQATTNTTLTAVPTTADVGQPVTLTANVSNALRLPLPSGVTIPTPSGTVTFLDNSVPIGTAPVLGGQANFSINTLGTGAHTITAAYSGGSNFLASTSAVVGLTIVRPAPATPGSATAVTQPVDLDGPRVTTLQRFGLHAQPTILVLTVSGPLDPARAQNVANYTVTGPNPAGIVTVSYAVAAAVYSPASDTVTLTFRRRLNVHRSYVIVVNGMAPGGLTSASGLLLDGNYTGQPGSNYETGFGRANLAGPASAARTAPATIARTVDALLAAGKLQGKGGRHMRH